jgi:hypothetical protein
MSIPTRYTSVDAWLDELEGYGLRRERLPDGALDWVRTAWDLGRTSATPAPEAVAALLMAALSRAEHPLDEMCVLDDRGDMTDVLLDGRTDLIRVAEELLAQWPTKSAGNPRGG